MVKRKQIEISALKVIVALYKAGKLNKKTYISIKERYPQYKKIFEVKE